MRLKKRYVLAAFAGFLIIYLFYTVLLSGGQSNWMATTLKSEEMLRISHAISAPKWTILQADTNLPCARVAHTYGFLPAFGIDASGLGKVDIVAKEMPNGFMIDTIGVYGKSLVVLKNSEGVPFLLFRRHHNEIELACP